MIDGVTNADSIPVLERLVQFTAARHRIIANNVANLDTPGFRPGDVSVAAFQARLGEAVDARRDSLGNGGGPLPLESSREVRIDGDRMRLDPNAIGGNRLSAGDEHGDLDRTMQSLVENFMAFRTAAELMRSRFELINTAIRERV